MLRLVFAACVVLLGCPRTNERAPTRSCLVPGVTREARCLTVEVPENPDVPDGRKLEVHAAVVPATGIRPLRDAVFVFAGGPGQAATDVAGGVMSLFAGLEARRDIVFVDQRGTGSSGPLRCPESDDGRRPLAESFDDELIARRLTDCRERLSDAGVDLAQYATWIAVRDVEAVRRKLGYGPVNLWGASYGTRAALEYARQFPEAVRTMVLDGVAPARRPLPVALAFDTDLVLEQVLQRADGGLTGVLEQLLAVDAGVVSVVDPFFGDRVEVPLTRARRVGLIRGPLYAPMLAASLPVALARAGQGDWSPLIGLQAGLGGGRLFEGMHFSVLCAEDVPRITEADRTSVASTRAGSTFIDDYERSCRGWPTRAVPPEFFSAPRFTAPVLVLSGGADPATPPRNADDVVRELPHARHLVAPNLGHGVSLMGCAPVLISRFVSEGSAEGLDGGCLAQLPAPTRFEVPTP